MTVEVYSQRDERWSGQHLGLPKASAQSTIGAYGCGITAIAQMLSLLGWTTTPPEVQAAFLATRGFRTDETLNLIAWWNVPMAYPQLQYNGRHDYPNTPVPQRIMTLIYERLEKQQPVIVYVDASPYEKGLQQHFVLVSARLESGDLVIHNPWNGKIQNLRPYGRTDPIAIGGVILLDVKFDAHKAI